jgi:serine/threonine protein kinase
MQGPEPPPLSERSSATVGRQPPAPRSGDSPTVVTGTGGSSAKRAQAAASSRATLLPLPGDRIDSFELEAAIGVGGMGAVFRALDNRLDRHVALKILPPEVANDAEVVQRFYQEGRAAARLDHENIARVYTIGQDAGFHFIAFEFIEGITIRQRVERDGPLPVGEAVNYTLQIASALVHASDRGVVHRDIKPSNIIITPQGRAKLVDMGLARRFERGQDDGLTQSGMTLGTFDYISPEQARDPRDVDVRSDLYSLGCTLFHMLTGRPPFPEGTVLQKLIQHQEEAPPDVRSLNAEVPEDLAAILVKLMAKERDRRYQTPEQLVRDLLILAGALGLRSVSPEGLLWMSAAHPPAWEGHLVWSIPALGFVIVLAVLAWWGQDSPAPLPGSSPNAVAQVPPVKPAEVKQSAENPTTERSEPELVESPAPAKEILVGSHENLLDILAKAPRRSTIVLTDDGPYILQSLTRLTKRDLTLKADSGVRPALLLAREAAGSGKGPPALLDFVDGQVTLDGLEFILEPRDRDDAISVRSDNTELTVRRCVFRRQGPRTKRGRVVALQVRSRSNAGQGDRTAPIIADSCHFELGQIGILATGPVDLAARDCTMAATEPAFWFENSKAASAVPIELRLRHDSILAGEGPVFVFEGTAPRVWVEDTVIGPARDARATLVAIDDPGLLDWRGRGNVLARVGTFLQPTGSRPGRGPVRDALQWAEGLANVRETGSNTTDERIWAEVDPGETREHENPSRAFRLVPSNARLTAVGARQSPFGPLTTSIVLADEIKQPTPARTANAVASQARTLSPSEKPAETPVSPPMPMAVPSNANSSPPLARAPGDMSDLPAMPPRPLESGLTEGTPSATNKEPAPMPSARGSVDQGRTEKPVTTVERPAANEADPAVLQTADQFLKALELRATRGGIFRVAANADWELPGIELRGTGRWTVRAEPGLSRPRIRFRPGTTELRASTSWTTWVELRSGSLQLEGIDIVLARSDAPREGRWAAFGVGAGADLSLSGCTVTIEGDRVPSAVVAVPVGEIGDEPAHGIPSAATVRLSDSLVRSGGDLVEISPRRRLELDLNDAVIATGGSLVHAHGALRGPAPDPIRLKIVLRQVTARMAGGLVRLESAPGEPDLPIADLNVRDSILATNPQGDPLFRVDGQDALASLRDRIVWEGHGVAYHQINTYRRDQSAQVGTFPSTYDRPSWTVAVGPKEQSAVHGDVKFLKEWDATRAPWTLKVDDVKLDGASPASAAGADLANIPSPPSSGS